MRTKRLVLALVGPLLALAGCTRSPLVNLGGHYNLTVDVPPGENRNVDILFVVDNSGAMGPAQNSLLRSVRAALFDRLAAEMGELPSVHVGVVSTNVGAGGFQITGCGGDGDDGRLLNSPRSECTPPAGYYISDLKNDVDGTRTINYSTSLGETFECIARLGTDGCGFEQPLESMRRALDGSQPQNAGFLRDDALLLVVLLTDEDDCSAKDVTMFDPSQTDIASPLGPLSSFRCFEWGVVCDDDDPRTAGLRDSCTPRADSPYMQDPATYVDFLRGLKADPTMVIVSGIYGDPAPVKVCVDKNGKPELATSCGPDGYGSCPPATPFVPGTPDASPPPDPIDAGPVVDGGPPPPDRPITGYPGIRLQQFVDAFAARGTFSSICGDDMTAALTTTASLVTSVALRRSCLRGALRDVNDAAPGLQPRCRVYDATRPLTADEHRSEISACDASAGLPCYTLAIDDVGCADTASHLVVSVDRTIPAPADSHLLVECLAP